MIVNNYYLVIFSIFCILLILDKKFKNNKIEKFKNNKKIAKIFLTKKPIDYDIWLKYHLHTLKFDKLYVRIEDTPELKSILQSYNTRVSATYVSKVDKKKYIQDITR